MTGMLPALIDADWDLPPAPPATDEDHDRRDEAREAAECGCRACDPGWWADEEQFERSQDV